MNYTRRIAFTVASVLAIATLAACATDSNSGDQLSIEQRDAITEQTEQSTDAAATPAAEMTPEPTDELTAAPVVMPNLVGMNLQLAQDTLQALGSYLLDQKDASGLDRVQVIDSNWQVCVQEPAPGSTIMPEALVTLSSVKLEEPCP